MSLTTSPKDLPVGEVYLTKLYTAIIVYFQNKPENKQQCGKREKMFLVTVRYIWRGNSKERVFYRPSLRIKYFQFEMG